MGLLDIILAKLKLQRSLAKDDDDSFEDVKTDAVVEEIEKDKIEQVDTGIDPRFLKILDDKIKQSNEKLLIGVATVIDEVIGDLEPDDQSHVNRAIEQANADIRKNHDSIENVKIAVDEKIKEHAATLDAFIDIVSERVSNDKTLAECFKRDECPFDVKIGKCQMWMHRPVRNDAPNYCGPCRLQKMLKEKGL